MQKEQCMTVFPGTHAYKAPHSSVRALTVNGAAERSQCRGPWCDARMTRGAPLARRPWSAASPTVDPDLSEPRRTEPMPIASAAEGARPPIRSRLGG